MSGDHGSIANLSAKQGQGCDGDVVIWCEDGDLFTIDCGSNEPPSDVCGWNDGVGFFDCGGTDPVPDGLDPQCPWTEPCVPDCTGLECGPDPLCGQSCGTCDADFVCIEGMCEAVTDELTCGDPGPIACGDTLTGDTTGAVNLINSYPGCSGLTESGGEHVYRFAPAADAQVTVTLSGMTADLDLFVLEGSCNGAACIAYSAGVSTETVTFDALAGTVYYIVVDGYSGAADSYSLTMTCQ